MKIHKKNILSITVILLTLIFASAVIATSKEDCDTRARLNERQSSDLVCLCINIGEDYTMSCEPKDSVNTVDKTPVYGVDKSKINESSPVCTTTWNCSDWEACKDDNTQDRICTKADENCSTEDLRPIESQSCENATDIILDENSINQTEITTKTDEVKLDSDKPNLTNNVNTSKTPVNNESKNKSELSYKLILIGLALIIALVIGIHYLYTKKKNKVVIFR